MNRLNPGDLPTFLRKYRFPGGRVRRVQLRTSKGAMRLTVLLKVRKADDTPATLKFELTNVEEYRFQKRPNTPAGRLAECRMAYLQGRVYLTLDSLGLPPGEAPGIHDFRASEAYAAGDALLWEEVAPKAKG
jgi:hypothetical protein